MLKNILKATIFTVILVALLLGASFLFKPKDNTEEAGMYDLSANGIMGEADQTVDVLILGDSESYFAFMPLKLWNDHGITAYGCGTLAQILPYSEEFLHKAFEKQSPKVVILETDNIFTWTSPDDSILHKTQNVLPIFQYHDRWKNMTKNDFNFEYDSSYIDLTKGYYLAFDVKEPVEYDWYMYPSKECEEIPVTCYEYVKDIAKYCDENGAKLVFVSTPSVKCWNMMRHNSVEKLAEELGIDYIDMNLIDEIGIDWTRDTRDAGDHMNYFGATKVTEYLGNYLIETGLFSSHRGDEKYTQWDTNLEEFNAIIAKTSPDLCLK